MKVAVLGTGDVGQALGKALITLGHEVMMGSRDAKNEKAVEWARDAGPTASVGTFADAAEFGEWIVLATLGIANEAVLQSAGPAHFVGKVVIDATNPLDFSGGVPPKLALAGNDSGGEAVQRMLRGADVVKAFNTVGNALMFRPKFEDGPPDMFIAGNSEDAKARVAKLLADFGWGVVDVGGIESSRYLEAMCMVWVITGFQSGTWSHAFKLLRQ